MKTCICDKCAKEMEISIQQKVIDRDKDGHEVIEQFFVCPNCSAHYVVIILDQLMREKIAARKCFKTNSKMYKKLTNEMKRHFKELRAKYQ